MQQAVVVEGLGRAQHDVAVHVVLKMLGRLVAHAHRAHAPVACQLGHKTLGQVFLQPNAIQRLDVAVAAFDHHVAQPAQVVLHRAHLGDAVERAHHKKRIAQPAVAVVPVAAAVGGFGDAGRHGGHDGAGFFVQRQLERDGCADHRVLPLQRNGQRAAPAAPVGRGLLLEVAGGVGNAVHQRFVRAQQKVVFAREHKRLARQHMRHRRIGGQAQRHALAHIADVVAAARDLGGGLAPVVTHLERHPDARRALDGPHPAHQRHGPEVARAAVKARRKVGDLDAVARLVEQLRAQDGGVGLVPLVGRCQVFQLDRKVAALVARLQQGVEHRVAIKARQAAPHHAGVVVDECADGAVADHPKVERARLGVCGGCVHRSRSSVVRADDSQPRSAADVMQRCCAMVGPSPTLMPQPPSA